MYWLVKSLFCPQNIQIQNQSQRSIWLHTSGLCISLFCLVLLLLLFQYSVLKYDFFWVYCSKHSVLCDIINIYYCLYIRPCLVTDCQLNDLQSTSLTYIQRLYIYCTTLSRCLLSKQVINWVLSGQASDFLDHTVKHFTLSNQISI